MRRAEKELDEAKHLDPQEYEHLQGLVRYSGVQLAVKRRPALILDRPLASRFHGIRTNVGQLLGDGASELKRLSGNANDRPRASTARMMPKLIRCFTLMCCGNPGLVFRKRSRYPTMRRSGRGRTP
jgi:hypothetical protein